jgi:homogentisate 1,2-dioxygenase
MFESSFSMAVTNWALHSSNKVDHGYHLCWQGLRSHFNENWRPDVEEMR